jgi:hypothetical protein
VTGSGRVRQKQGKSVVWSREWDEAKEERRRARSEGRCDRILGGIREQEHRSRTIHGRGRQLSTVRFGTSVGAKPVFPDTTPDLVSVSPDEVAGVDSTPATVEWRWFGLLEMGRGCRDGNDRAAPRLQLSGRRWILGSRGAAKVDARLPSGTWKQASGSF